MVAKRGTAAYPLGRRSSWVKIRHATTAEAAVVGYTGPRRRPRNLALVTDAEQDRVRLSARLDQVLAVHAGTALADAPVTGKLRAGDESYTGIDMDLVVEILAGSGRHGTLTVTRMR